MPYLCSYETTVRGVYEDSYNRADPYGTIGIGTTIVGGTGFTLWERAAGEEKYMAFMKGATHNGFVTKNKADYNSKGEFFDPKSSSNDKWKTASVFRAGKKAHPDDFVAPEKTQRVVLAGFTNAFFRYYLHQEEFWKPLLRGERLPNSMEDQNATISFQYQNKPTEKEAITFLTGMTDNVITDGRAEAILKMADSSVYVAPVVGSGLVGTNVLNIVRRMDGYLDFFSPHGIPALLYDLSIISSVTIYGSPSPILNAGTFTHLSFRITRVFNYALDPANPPNELIPLAIADLQSMSIIFNSSFSATLPVNIFEPIRRYDRGFHSSGQVVFDAMNIAGTLALGQEIQQIFDAFVVGKTKSAMATVRIALDDIIGLSKSSITDISIDFGTSLGLVALDSFEFTN